MNPTTAILLVEDDEIDVLLLRRALKEADVQNPLHVAHDGQAAIDFLTRSRAPTDDRLPALVILDLQMPRLNGMEVLAWLREQPVLNTLPVCVFSSSGSRDDIERAYVLGAHAYVVKPPSLAERLEVARFFKQWLRFVRPPLAAGEGLGAAHRAHASRDYARQPGGLAP